MSADQALELALALLQVTAFVAGPVLLASLLAGVSIGIVQAATQVNEASISFITKAGAIVVVLVTLGPMLAAHALSYTRASLVSIEHVVR
jgi:flagellar biosynthetic protein FliQ